MNQIMKRFWLVAIPFWLTVALMVAVSLYSPLIMGDDPYSLLRYVVIRLSAAMIAAPFLGGLMLLTDFITPGEWMETIKDDPKACSYIMSAVVIVIGAVLCWA